jgi:hypothetical protein
MIFELGIAPRLSQNIVQCAQLLDYYGVAHLLFPA